MMALRGLQPGMDVGSLRLSYCDMVELKALTTNDAYIDDLSGLLLNFEDLFFATCLL